MRVDAAHAAFASPLTQTDFASSAARTEAAAAQQPGPSAPAASDATRLDFTGMTRHDLMGWVNDRLLAGEMSFDESSAFLAMSITLETGAEGSSAGLDDSEPMNFLEIARGALDFMKQHGDASGVARYERAIETMLRNQGTLSGMDVRA